MKTNETKNFYTPNGWQGANFDSKLGTKEIAAKIREFCKKEFANCKFEVRKTDYNSFYVAVLESDRDVRTEQGKARTFYLQLGHYISDSDKMLNEHGKEMFKKIAQFANSYNYDDSDGMIDYFDTWFYLNMYVGTWQNDFKLTA